MIPIALAVVLATVTPAQTSEAPLRTLAADTVERCWQAGADGAPSSTVYPDSTDAQTVILRVSQSRCDLSADRWTADDGALLDQVWTTLRGVPAWEVESVREFRANERGPAQWTAFVQYSADGDEIARVTVIEPLAGQAGFFELTYVMAEP